MAGRSEAALDDVIGLVTNTLVLRTDVSDDPGFRELLARTRRFDLAALDHQDLPFDLLVNDLNPPRHPARHPLFQVMLALQNNEPAVLRLGDQRTALRPTATGTAKFDLFVDVVERHDEQGAPEGLDLHVEYATDLFAAETAVRFTEALSAVLAAGCADPELRMSDLPAREPRPQSPPGDLAAVALEVAGVRDAVVLPSPEASGPPSLYVVPGRAGPVEPDVDAARVTAVSGLPRTPDGALDTDALRALTGVREASVELADAAEELGRVHAGPTRAATGPEASPEPESRTDGVPALSEGPALTEPSVSSWAAALTRAAAKPHGEIVHVRADGSEDPPQLRLAGGGGLPGAGRAPAARAAAGRPGDPPVLGHRGLHGRAVGLCSRRVRGRAPDRPRLLRHPFGRRHQAGGHLADAGCASSPSGTAGRGCG